MGSKDAKALAKRTAAMTLLNKAKTELCRLDDVRDVLKFEKQAKYLAEMLGTVKSDDAEGYAALLAISEVRLRARRRGGELIREGVKTKTIQGHGGDRSSGQSDHLLTLSAVGLSAGVSKRWQLESRLPQKQFEQWVTKLTAKGAGRELTADGLRSQAKAWIAGQGDNGEDVGEIPSTVTIKRCSMQTLLAGTTGIDAIITDPPYTKRAHKQYVEMAKLAPSALKPDGVLAVMCGQDGLAQLTVDMSKHIRFRWMVAYLLPGGQSSRIMHAKVNQFWKPVLLFGRSRDWLGDVAKSKANDKRFHKWGQSVGGMVDLVERLSEPGDLVCDPFLGAGTTGVASVVCGRNFCGCDTDAEAIRKAKGRLRHAGRTKLRR